MVQRSFLRCATNISARTPCLPPLLSTRDRYDPWRDGLFCGYAYYAFRRRADQLEKRPADKTAHGNGDTSDPEEQDPGHPEQVQQDTDESWASCLDPELFLSQSVVPSELVPSHEWPDVVVTASGERGPLGPGETPTRLPLDPEPLADVPGMGGESSPCGHLVLPVSELTTAKAPTGDAGGFSPTSSAVCGQGQDHCGANASSAVVVASDGVTPRTEPCSTLESLLL